ncbi:MAG: AraC family transcriptional regulator [Planctomycetota bacterium]
MQLPLEKSLTIRPLYKSERIGISDYICRAPQSGPADEEHPDEDSIVLLRCGVFRKHIARAAVTADTNQAVFFTRGSSYRVSHPADGGNRGTIFSPTPDLLTDLLGEHDPAYECSSDQPFPFMIGPCPRAVFLRHRELLKRLEQAEPTEPDPMLVEELSLHLMAEVLGSAFSLHAEPSKRRRLRTPADHTDRVEAAKALLASQMSEPISLTEVADHVGFSVFHLSRVFRERTGSTVYRYLTQLRMRAALERLAEGERDLTGLALDLGYASHSHFTDTFRREFGQAPSVVRDSLCSVRPV